MLMPKPGIFVLSVLIAFCSSLRAEDPDRTQRFVLLSTLRFSTLEKELRQTAGAGYEIQFASNEASGGGGGLPQAFTEHNQLVMEKTGSSERRDYLFLKSRGETTANVFTFLESDMNEAAAKGYRFRARTFLGLMEKRGVAEAGAIPKYRVLQGPSKELQEKSCEASKEGFHFVDLFSGAMVMEKRAEVGGAVAVASAAAPQTTACPYLVIGARTGGALRKEMEAGAARGFHVVAAACPGEIVVLMEKSAADTGSKEFLILDSMRIGKLQRDLAEAATRGYQAIPRAFITYSTTNVAIMENRPGTKTGHEYLILEAQKSTNLQKKMTEAAGQGFRPVAMNSSRILLLEKTSQN